MLKVRVLPLMPVLLQVEIAMLAKKEFLKHSDVISKKDSILSELFSYDNLALRPVPWRSSSVQLASI